MKLGIFAKTFSEMTLEQMLDSVKSHNLTQIQFNMSCVGLPSLPDKIDSDIITKINCECNKRDIQIAAVSGTFNMIHPDMNVRREGLQRLRTLASACKGMGTAVITLCTGTRNIESMWKKHHGNGDMSAWKDLLETMESALEIAKEFNIILGVEPEVSNVIDSAEKCRKLLDEFRSPNLKVIMDAANLFHAGEAKQMRKVMENAFMLLGEDIVIAHAKDIANGGEPEFVAAGQGILDYDTYLKLLKMHKFNGALIIHGLADYQVKDSVSFIKQKMKNYN